MQLSNTSPGGHGSITKCWATGRCKTRRDGARERRATVGNRGTTESHWVTAARDLADAVRTGRYSPDERLTTLVSLAVANQVHPRTMSRALRRLRELGYVTYRQGYGYFVSHTPPGYE